MKHIRCRTYGFLVVVMSLVLSCTSSTWAQSRFASTSYKKPIFAYLGMVGADLNRLSTKRREYLEKAIREKLEKGRFHFLKIASKGMFEAQFAQKMATLASARVMGIAKLRAAWDNEFQGYAVTTEQLSAVKDKTYYYWMEFHSISPPSPSSALYEIEVTLHIRRLSLFRCTAEMKRKNERNLRACRGKKATEYSGVVQEKIDLKANSLETTAAKIAGPGSSRTVTTVGNVFEHSVRVTRDELYRLFTTRREFQLHAPVESASFASLTTSMGRAEGLRQGTWLGVYVRKTSGRLSFRGYAKVTSVGDNRVTLKDGKKIRLNPKARFLSSAQIISGTNLQKGMMLYEYPKNGSNLALDLVMAPYRLDTSRSIDRVGFGSVPVLDGTGLTPALRLMGAVPLTEETNINEFFVKFGIEVGLFGGNTSLKSMLTLLIHVGLSKKFYFLRNLAWVIGLRASLGGVFASDLRSADPEAKYANFVIGGEAVTGFDIFINPEWSILLRGGFRGITSFNTGVTGVPEILSLGPWFSAGLQFTL